jgi:hypothetical protein
MLVNSVVYGVCYHHKTLLPPPQILNPRARTYFPKNIWATIFLELKLVF